MLCGLGKFSLSFGIVVWIETICFMTFTFIGGMVPMSNDMSWLVIGFGIGFLANMMSFAFNVMLCFGDFSHRRNFIFHHVWILLSGVILFLIGISLYSTGRGGTSLMGMGPSYILCLPLSMFFFQYNHNLKLCDPEISSEAATTPGYTFSTERPN